MEALFDKKVFGKRGLRVLERERERKFLQVQ